MRRGLEALEPRPCGQAAPDFTSLAFLLLLAILSEGLAARGSARRFRL